MAYLRKLQNTKLQKHHSPLCKINSAFCALKSLGVASNTSKAFPIKALKTNLLCSNIVTGL